MKKSHIFLIAVLGIAVAIIISTANNTSQYVDFAKASAMAQSGSDQKVHIIGVLQRGADGQPKGIEYDPIKDPNTMRFVLIDEKGQSHSVISNPPSSMQDFLKSEKVVVEGRMRDGQFVASEILLKCPSKYEETELKS